MFQTNYSTEPAISKRKNPEGTSDIFQALKSHRRIFDQGSQVIQRAVGFEIELSYNLYRNREHLSEMVKENVPVRSSRFERFKKDDVLLKGKDFELRVDVSPNNLMPYLEIVTVPFDDTAEGWDKLNAAFDAIVAMMHDLFTVAQRWWTNLGFLEVFKKHGEIDPKDHEIRLKGFFPLSSGGFQMTAGIDLERVPIVFQDLAWPEEAEDAALSERRAKGRKWFIDWRKEKADDYLPELNEALGFQKINKVLNEMQFGLPESMVKKMAGAIPWSAKLSGLLSMIAQYLLLANQELERYPKSFSVLFGRTDFVHLFELLSDEEKAFFRVEKNWFHLMDELIRRLDIGGINEPFYSKGIYHNYGEEFKDMRYALSPLSRMSWLMEIPKGKDLLTEKFFPIPEFKSLFRSFGEFAGKYDTIEVQGQKVQVPIFEFRMISNKLHYVQWKRFAQEAYQWVLALNAGLDQKFGEWKPQVSQM
ncbi:MAG: hypothetical protein MI784_16530 [Cytophagales bacterium]|nr:hypothetical protein [Cytophagales bacterium]